MPGECRDRKSGHLRPCLALEVAEHKEDFWRKTPIDNVQALSSDLLLVPTGEGLLALEVDYTAMGTSGMLRGKVPTLSELMERVAQLVQQCNERA